MNLVYFNHNIIWRSAFQRCFDLGRHLVAKGHRVTLITNSATERSQWKESIIEGVRVVESPDLLEGPLRTGWDPVNVLRRIGWCNRNFPKGKTHDSWIVHAFDTRPTVIHPAMALRDRLQCPLVIDWGDWWGGGGAIRLRKPFWLNFLFEPVETYYEENYKFEADWLTAVSKPLSERAADLGFPRERISIIPNPADPKAVQPMDQHQCRRELRLDPDTFYAIFSGWVLYDLPLLLREMELLARRLRSASSTPLRKVGLILTGAKLGLKQGDYSFELVQAGLTSRQDFVKYLSAADVALMPLSEHLANEGRFPGKVGAYLAAGLPVVMNRVGDVARILEAEGLGCFANQREGGFADVLLRLLNDPEAGKLLGKKGREFTERKYNWEYEASRLLEVYEKLIGQNAATSQSGLEWGLTQSR